MSIFLQHTLWYNSYRVSVDSVSGQGLSPANGNEKIAWVMVVLDVNTSLSTPVLQLEIATEISAFPGCGRLCDSAWWHHNTSAGDQEYAQEPLLGSAYTK